MAKKKNLTIRIDDQTRDMLEIIANREMRPLANQIMYFLKQAIDDYAKKNQITFDMGLYPDEDYPLIPLGTPSPDD